MKTYKALLKHLPNSAVKGVGVSPLKHVGFYAHKNYLISFCGDTPRVMPYVTRNTGNYKLFDPKSHFKFCQGRKTDYPC